MAIERSRDPKAFIDFERAGWDTNIEGYERTLASVSRQTIVPLLDAANVQGGMRILDVCTGPGMLVEAAIERGAQATGLDLSAQAVELARKRVPSGEFRQGDAQALPFEDNSFDAIVCAYGVIHVPVPEQALREMFRVVRRGGRVAISVWDSTTANHGFGLIYAAVRAHGRTDVPVPHGPDYFQFSTDQKMRAALGDIGFSEVETKFVEQLWHVQSGAQILEAMRTGTVRARALLAAQSPDAMIKIEAFLDKALSGMRNSAGSFDVPLPALVGSGVKA